MEQQSIFELVRNAEDDYLGGITQISKYVDFSLYETINKIDAYLNSKHISGETDSLGREKPFFNIVTAVSNVWYRATDIDRKNIRIKASKEKDVLKSFVGTVKLKDWMKRSGLGVFLNEWGQTLADYGSAIVEFVEQDGLLKASVLNWNDIIVDAVDFEAAPLIKKLWLTPSQLKRNKSYDQTKVDELVSARKERREIISGQKKDNKEDFIEVYEVHGELPLAYLTDDWDNDWDEYTQQMWVVSYLEGNNGEWKDYALYSGRSKKQHLITHLKKNKNRILSIGSVENCFNAQWMVNHTVKNIKDYLDIVSKLILQSADQSFQGRNVLTAIEQGTILYHQPNMPLTQVNTQTANIQALQTYGQQWEALAKEITSTPESMRGETMPSGTPYSLGAYLGGQAGSLFEIFTENKGLAIEQMMREFILPYLKKQMDTSEEISAIMEASEIKYIDSKYLPNETTKRVNDEIKKRILKGEIVSPEEQAALTEETTQEIQEGLNSLGNQRFLKPSEIKTKTWKEYFKDFEWDVEVEITNENTEKQIIYDVLNKVFEVLARTGGQMTEEMKLVFNKILEETGVISPIELNQSQTKAQPQIQPEQPQTKTQPLGAGQPVPAV